MSWPAWLPLRADLLPLTPYGAPQIDAQAKLNTNESPFGLSSALQQAINTSISNETSTLNRYPDRDAIKLRFALANYINESGHFSFGVENIWAANGSNEIIQSLFLAFGGAGAVGFTPSYSMHPLIAKVAGTSWINGKRNEDLSFNLESAISELLANKPKLTFITTPNNPTGEGIPLREIALLAEVVGNYGGLLIIDEAYAEFSNEVSGVALIDANPHVVAIRTMSKAFAFAGARVGYLIANPRVVDAIMLVRLPYHLSALTQAAAQAALEFREELLANVAELTHSRDRLAASLNSLGLHTLPSSANFILFSGFELEPVHLWGQLLEKGVLIRDVGLSSYLRVTVGNEAENSAFIEALTQILKKARSL